MEETGSGQDTLQTLTTILNCAWFNGVYELEKKRITSDIC
jgi:hypothetical protein